MRFFLIRLPFVFGQNRNSFAEPFTVLTEIIIFNIQLIYKMNIVFFTGAGISAESGIKTFRDADGLWEDHSIYEVATPEAFERNPELVLEFYNQRRRQMYEVEPNKAHVAIAKMQEEFQVDVVTQNVDNLHERAGCKNVLHLHGELDKGRSSAVDGHYVDLGGKAIQPEDRAKDGSRLRPHVVWFGEAVPAIEAAAVKIQNADVLVIVGTSLQVYPAADLIHETKANCNLYYIDPKAEIPAELSRHIELINEPAVQGVQTFEEILRRKLI